jgi:hypothetical protein
MTSIKSLYITGTGACGFLEANALLGSKFAMVYKSENGKYQNAYTEQNSANYPVWETKKISEAKKKKITDKILEQNLISHIIIKYIDNLIEKNPSILILCLRATKESTVKNLVWSWGYANPLLSKPRKPLREVNRYPLSQFPDYSMFNSAKEATELFYDEFYTLAEFYSERYPNNFKLIDSSAGIASDLYKLNLIEEVPNIDHSGSEIYTTNLNGGVGNMLFQMSEAITFAKQFGYPSPRFGYWSESNGSVFPKYYKPDRAFGGHDVSISDFNGAFVNIQLEHFKEVNFKTHFQVSNMFNFAEFADPESIKLKINSTLRLNAVALHLRFGGLGADISSVPKIRSSYYKRVFRKIPKHLPVYVYSDNPDQAQHWKNSFEKKFGREIVLRECNAIQSLQEMANCEYHVLHSSTFSFWSAYLDPEQPDSKVFYPKEFLKLHGPKMISCKSWVCI